MIREILKTFKSIYNLTKNKNIDIDKKILYLESIQSQNNLFLKEKSVIFEEEYKEKLRRGNIVWVEFGFNVGHEFGGRHPAIVMRYINNGEDIYVVPLDSGTLPCNKTIEQGYVEIPKFDNKCLTVFDMAQMDRWCNVYRLRCISWSRIDFTQTIGRMRVDYVDKIDETILTHRYKTIKKSKNTIDNVKFKKYNNKKEDIIKSNP